MGTQAVKDCRAAGAAHGAHAYYRRPSMGAVREAHAYYTQPSWACRRSGPTHESRGEQGGAVEDKRNRLQQKYYVYRIDERDRAGGDRCDSKYFVLDYIHDPYSIPALEAYALACHEDLPNLSQELRTLINSLKAGQPDPGQGGT